MPKPNVIPEPDWRAIFAAANTYDQWRARGEYPKNLEAMETIRKDQVLGPDACGFLARLDRTVNVLVMAEDWCPDVVRHVPVLQKMTEYSGKLVVRYITRADNLDVLVRFHTNGTESVPKMGFFNDAFALCCLWGPMPRDCRELIQRGRACNDLKRAREKVFALYIEDAQRAEVVRELIACIDIASAKSP